MSNSRQKRERDVPRNTVPSAAVECITLDDREHDPQANGGEHLRSHNGYSEANLLRSITGSSMVEWLGETPTAEPHSLGNEVQVSLDHDRASSVR